MANLYFITASGTVPQFHQDFIRFAIDHGVLRFGEFKTKAGRLSPYFFNSGLFQDGAALRELCQFYAQAILASGVEFDMLFGPAYKGIPLVAGTAIALAEQGRNVPYCFNRKEAKDHGEGGMTVGAGFDGAAGWMSIHVSPPAGSNPARSRAPCSASTRPARVGSASPAMT